MIPRIRLIITALLVCHLFLLPGLLTSQLRPSQQQQNPTPSTSSPPPPSASPGSSPSDEEDDDDLDDLFEDNPPATPPQQPAPKSGVTAQSDTGQEDTQTEKIIEQELQSSNDQELGPARPAMNVPLGSNEVLIRADQQDKNQDIYTGRGHVEIRFGTSTLHADEVIYDASTGQLTASGHVVFDGGRHNEHLVGTHATYDISRDTGTFYDVTGSSGVRVHNKVSSSPPRRHFSSPERWSTSWDQTAIAFITAS